jgi:hypothetical protein
MLLNALATHNPTSRTRPDARNCGGATVDFDAKGDVVGFDRPASRKLDLSKIETIALPAATAD